MAERTQGRSDMRIVLASVLLIAMPAWAQAPAPAPKPLGAHKAMDPQKQCPECGVVTSVRVKKKELPPADSADSRPSGLVASVPLGGGKATVGSSSKREGKD